MMAIVKAGRRDPMDAMAMEQAAAAALVVARQTNMPEQAAKAAKMTGSFD